ncbi:periplasmic binding protein [Moraxella macacae 0408225]|uniref:Periplasmic binding protein n=2 Tax=Moraxella macacae TaxID=765840 RepID=L2FA20_9GAMM|nr:periplasmic binding protein [Moraxella macacae 0408225]
MTIKCGLLLAVLCTLNACEQSQLNQTNQTSNQTNSQINSETNNQAIKVITPDWAIASTLTAMGYPPVATGDVKIYPTWVFEPKLPVQTIDLGARYAPNPERLAQLHPDIIIDSDFYAHLRPLYGDIPHEAISFIPQSEVASWQDYVKPTQKLGEIIQKPDAAEQFLAKSKQRLNELGKNFHQKNPDIQKLAVVQFADANNLRMYVSNSLFQPVFDEMDLQFITLENELGAGNQWGFLSITLGDLTKLDNDVCLVVVEPFDPMLHQELTHNLLWQRLGYANNRCMAVVKPLWIYGGVASMLTFANWLNEAEFKGSKLS